MKRVVVTDEQWVTSWSFLVAHPRGSVGRPAACRRFLNAVRWGRRRGAHGRVLPAELGRWNRVFTRFSRWSERGGWADWHRQVAADPAWQAVLLERTVGRAHAGAAGAKQATRMPKPWGARAAASALSSMQ